MLIVDDDDDASCYGLASLSRTCSVVVILNIAIVLPCWRCYRFQLQVWPICGVVVAFVADFWRCAMADGCGCRSAGAMEKEAKEWGNKEQRATLNVLTVMFPQVRKLCCALI